MHSALPGLPLILFHFHCRRRFLPEVLQIRRDIPMTMGAHNHLANGAILAVRAALHRPFARWIEARRSAHFTLHSSPIRLKSCGSSSASPPTLPRPRLLAPTFPPSNAPASSLAPNSSSALP